MKLRMVLVVAALAAVAVACGGKQNKAPTPPVTEEPVTEPATGGGGGEYGGGAYGGGGADEEEAIREVEAIADEICACADQACVQNVMESAETRMQKWENFKPSAAGEARLEAIVQRMMECAQKIAASEEGKEP